MSTVVSPVEQRVIFYCRRPWPTRAFYRAVFTEPWPSRVNVFATAVVAVVCTQRLNLFHFKHCQTNTISPTGQYPALTAAKIYTNFNSFCVSNVWIFPEKKIAFLLHVRFNTGIVHSRQCCRVSHIGWRWRNFVPYLCQFIFAAILTVYVFTMFVAVIALNYALLVSQWSYGHFLN